MNENPNVRSIERLRHHYEVERELAEHLRKSTREQRTTLFGELYNELFRRVPDHPRLTRLESSEQKRRNVAAQMRLLSEWLNPDTSLIEFAPGNCWLSFEAAKTAGRVIAVDISDQRDATQLVPKNFQHVCYDGTQLDLPPSCADVAFSYQFLEHLHPDDVGPHFELVHRLLKPGGVYVFDTPHRYSGPHDISRYFSDTLDCFHFQEWTHREMRKLLASHGFKPSWVFRFGKTQHGIVNFMTDFAELCARPFPHRLRRSLFGRLFPSVAMVAVKEEH
jgi:SAM-dependent methyltransferase